MGNPLLASYTEEIRYLLGRMDPGERDEFGQRVIEDEETFDRVREAEKELYDAFAREALPADLQADFRLHLLQTPRQRMRLSAARVLAHRGLRSGLAPVAVLAIAAGILLGIALVPRLFRSGGNVPPAVVLQLRIDQTRAGSALPEFRAVAGLPAELRIPLNAAEPGRVFRVKLESRGAVVWSEEVAPSQGELAIRLGAGLLQPGPYELSVTNQAGEPVGFAEFRVVPR